MNIIRETTGHAMHKNERLELEALLLEHLAGKMTLMLTSEERASAVKGALQELLSGEGKAFANTVASGEERNNFIKEFLSYGMIEELLYDAEIEDIIINALKTYLHSSFSKRFYCDR